MNKKSFWLYVVIMTMAVIAVVLAIFILVVTDNKKPSNQHLKEYDKVVNEGNIKIGNLIALPVSVQKIILNEYKENEAEYSEEEAAAILNEKAERFIKHLKENEVQINDYHVNIERSGDKYIAHADIDATVPADFDVRKVETSDE